MLLGVTADDRSGAMEAAALCADAGLDTVVVSWDGQPATADCVVTDLRTRHLSADRAALRMTAAAPGAGIGHVHKIDSTLRGNWVGEIEALVAAGRRVLVIPSYPAAGRTCRDGVVRVYGIPVGLTEFTFDLAPGVRDSRPATALAGAAELAGPDEVSEWATAPGLGPAVADATTDDDLEALIAAVGMADDIVVAGPAAVVGAVARRRAQASRPASRPAPGVPSGRVLVVRGSRHSASRDQTEAVRHRHDVTVIEPPADLVAPPEVIALELAVRAHDHLAAHDPPLVVLLGGDTADAFLGERPVRVLGSVGVGMALGEVDVDGRRLGVVTKPGGFGATNALVELLESR